MESARGEGREQARSSVRALVKAKAEALKEARPDIVLGLLVGSALAPLAGTLGPGGPAVATAFAQVIGGVGGNLLSNLVGDAITKGWHGKGDEGATADAIATRVTAALSRRDATARQLSAEVIKVLQELGCIQAALEASDQGLREHVTASLRQLAEGDREILSVLQRVDRQQRRQTAGIEEAVDRLRALTWSAPEPQPPQLVPVFLAAGGAAIPGATLQDEVPLARRWRAGEEGWAGDRRYLLLDDGDDLLRDGRDASGERIQRQALARQTIPAPRAGEGYAWLRQAGQDLTRERELLARVRDAAGNATSPGNAGGTGKPGVPGGRTDPGLAGLPKVRHYEAAGGVATLAVSWPAEKDGLPCRTARARFTPGRLDPWRVSLLLAGLRSLTFPLDRLHRLGLSHRVLTPDATVVTANGQFVLRDLGLAATGFRPGEGPAGYQAPEQAFGARGGRPGPAIDVYQLAAMAYHLITGRVPAGTTTLPPPLHPALPETTSDMIAAALAASPASRPRLHELRASLQFPRRSRSKPSAS
jgi:hypothetical protein